MHAAMHTQPCGSHHGVEQQTLVLVRHWRRKSVIFGCLNPSKTWYFLCQPHVLNNVLIKWRKVPVRPANSRFKEVCCAQGGYSCPHISQIILTLGGKCAWKCVEGDMTCYGFFEQHAFVLAWMCGGFFLFSFFTLAENYWHGCSIGVTAFLFNANASVAVFDIKPIKWLKSTISWSNGTF